MTEENILRLQVTVNDLVLSHVMQRHQQLNAEPPYQSEGDSLEVVKLQEVIEVDA